MSEPEESPQTFAVRLSTRAVRDIDAAVARLADISGDDIAADWLDALDQRVRALAAMPRSNQVIVEGSHFPGREVRQFIARRYSGSAAYRVIYEIRENSTDGPTVRILHVRHASSRPITKKDAREIDSQA